MQLKRLSNQELLKNTEKLVQQERELLLDILLHLKEIDMRRLYLEIGYPSLWAYCTQALKYSEAAAQRRIESMRALREIPALADKIETGALSLSNIAKVQSAVRRANLRIPEKKLVVAEKLELFLELENKSQRQADAILAEHFPEETKRYEVLRPLNREFSELKVSLPTKIVEKLERVKELFSHKNPNPSLAETLEMMADFVIARKDLSVVIPPQRKSKEKLSRQTQQEMSSGISARKSSSPRAAISTAKRRVVWQKAKGSCEYIDEKSGRRCGSRHQLEIEHVRPLALGGSDNLENLKLFCRSHNQLAARDATLI